MNWYTTAGLVMGFGPMLALIVYAVWVLRPERRQWREYLKGGAMVTGAAAWIGVMWWLLNQGARP